MFSIFSKGFNPDKDLQDLTGKVVIVTGGNAGIGFATVEHLLKHGAKVYIGARSEEKAQAAIERLKANGPNSGEVQYLNLDLSDVTKAKASAEHFLSNETRLDILINNAAQTLIPYGKSYHDIQDIMVVNYLSPVIFTHTLLPLMTKTASEANADVRIVNVASGSPIAVKSGARFRNIDDFNLEYANALLPKFTRYGLSKLALISWSKELQRRLVAEDIPIIVTSLNPGGVHTDGNKAFAAQQNFVVKNLFLLLSYSAFPSPTKGAYPSIIAAASPEVRANSKAYMGAYLEPSGKIGKSNSPTADCCNEELSQELWTTTEGILKDIGVLEGDHLQIIQN